MYFRWIGKLRATRKRGWSATTGIKSMVSATNVCQRRRSQDGICALFRFQLTERLPMHCNDASKTMQQDAICALFRFRFPIANDAIKKTMLMTRTSSRRHLRSLLLALKWLRGCQWCNQDNFADTHVIVYFKLQIDKIDLRYSCYCLCSSISSQIFK